MNDENIGMQAKRSIPEDKGPNMERERSPVKEGSKDLGLFEEIRSVVGEERRVKRIEEAEVRGIEGKAERSEDILHLLLLVLLVVAITATLAIIVEIEKEMHLHTQKCFDFFLQDKKVDRDW